MLHNTPIPAILAITLLPTLAEAAEINFLTCTIGTKQLSLSKQDDDIIYRFGPAGKPELVLKEPVATVDFQPWNGLGSTDADAVTFYNQNYSYTVITTSPYENFRNGIHYHDITIWVERDGKNLASLNCKEELAGNPLDYLREAKAAIGQCWNREQQQWSENCAD